MWTRNIWTLLLASIILDCSLDDFTFILTNSYYQTEYNIKKCHDCFIYIYIYISGRFILVLQQFLWYYSTISVNPSCGIWYYSLCINCWVISMWMHFIILHFVLFEWCLDAIAKYYRKGILKLQCIYEKYYMTGTK